MPAPESARDLPILLLHDVDPTLSPSDLNEVLADVSALESALREQGHFVANVPVRDADLAAYLRGFAPDEYLVFNWCESLPGVPHSEALVAQTLERKGYTYTGSPPDVLALSWDKPRVKMLLGAAGVPTPMWRVYSSDRPEGWHCFPAIVKPAREHCSLGITPGVFYVLDVNPNPDISAETSTVYAANEAGYSYGAMLSRMAALGATRHPLFGSARRH